METTLRQRLKLLRDLVPWDDPNFALDEGWARFRPYAATIQPGATLTGAVVIMNHSPASQAFRLDLNLPAGWKLKHLTPVPVRVPPRQEGAVHFAVTVPEDTPPGVHLLTADIRWDQTELREWSELMVELP